MQPLHTQTHTQVYEYCVFVCVFINVDMEGQEQLRRWWRWWCSMALIHIEAIERKNELEIHTRTHRQIDIKKNENAGRNRHDEANGMLLLLLSICC